MKLAAAILRELRTSPIPVSTPQLTLLCAVRRSYARQRVHVTLARLLTAGVVRKERRRLPTGNRGGLRPVCVWSLSGGNR